MTADVFRDRRHAGRVLAKVLAGYANRSDVIVLALPRGGSVDAVARFVRGLGNDAFADDALAGFQRFPTWSATAEWNDADAPETYPTGL